MLDIWASILVLYKSPCYTSKWSVVSLEHTRNYKTMSAVAPYPKIGTPLGPKPSKARLGLGVAYDRCLGAGGGVGVRDDYIHNNNTLPHPYAPVSSCADGDMLNSRFIASYNTIDLSFWERRARGLEREREDTKSLRVQ